MGATQKGQVAHAELEEMFTKIDQCFDKLEEHNNLHKAEVLLKEYLDKVSDPAVRSRIYAMLAQVEFWRYEYAPEKSKERRVVAKKGADLAKKALELDENNMWANAWASAMMGIHGQEEGILSILHYLPKIEGYAKRAIELDENYNNAMAHQVLGNLYRLSPPKPISVGSKKKSLEEFERVRELAPSCPVAAISFAELQLSRRKKDDARKLLQFVIDTEKVDHGPEFMAKQKEKAKKLIKKT
jgi:tetratricopeptide (TPR) repeat protein